MPSSARTERTCEPLAEAVLGRHVATCTISGRGRSSAKLYNEPRPANHHASRAQRFQAVASVAYRGVSEMGLPPIAWPRLLPGRLTETTLFASNAKRQLLEAARVGRSVLTFGASSARRVCRRREGEKKSKRSRPHVHPALPVRAAVPCPFHAQLLHTCFCISVVLTQLQALAHDTKPQSVHVTRAGMATTIPHPPRTARTSSADDTC